MACLTMTSSELNRILGTKLKPGGEVAELGSAARAPGDPVRISQSDVCSRYFNQPVTNTSPNGVNVSPSSLVVNTPVSCMK
jgi:hypothetical protein